MEQSLAQYWRQLLEFLKEYDTERVTRLIRATDWNVLLHRPLFWLITVPLLGWLVWKKYFRMMLLGLSLIAFVVLVQQTLPESGSVPLDRILAFIGGCLVLIAINFYFLFIRRG